MPYIVDSSSLQLRLILISIICPQDGKIARARDMFFHSEAHFLLYSERAHFYRRLRVKGVRHVVFYQPPTYPHFYSEICNLMQVCFVYLLFRYVLK